MLIYEVNLAVAKEAAKDFEVWLPGHMEKVVKLGGFEKVLWFKQSPLEWSVHYYVKDKATLERYLENHAPKLRQEGLEKFPGKFSASRRILELFRR